MCLHSFTASTATPAACALLLFLYPLSDTTGYIHGLRYELKSEMTAADINRGYCLKPSRRLVHIGTRVPWTALIPSVSVLLCSGCTHGFFSLSSHPNIWLTVSVYCINCRDLSGGGLRERGRRLFQKSKCFYKI